MMFFRRFVIAAFITISLSGIVVPGYTQEGSSPSVIADWEILQLFQNRAAFTRKRDMDKIIELYSPNCQVNLLVEGKPAKKMSYAGYFIHLLDSFKGVETYKLTSKVDSMKITGSQAQVVVHSTEIIRLNDLKTITTSAISEAVLLEKQKGKVYILASSANQRVKKEGSP